MAIGLVTVALAATVAAVVSTTRTEVHRQAEAQLESAAATARRMLEFRGSQLAAGARALSADFGLKAAVANGDGPTLRSALGNHGRRIGASLMVLYDADGRRLAGSGQQPSPSAAAQLGAVIAAGGDVRERQRFELIDGVPYQLVYAPVRAPDLIAWTVIGFTLDDAVAADMARVLGVEVSFVSRSSAGPVYVASSWQGTQRASVVGSAAARAGQPVTLEYAGEELLTRTEPAPTSDGWLTLVLQRSMSAALRPYAELRNAVVLIGATTLLAALGLGVWLARSALKPVELLTEAAQRLEAGDYSAEVPASSTRELSKLAAAFNAMRSAVRQREAQILHQAHYDALTGLPNRSSAARILARMIGEAGPESGPLAVLRIDLSHFQDINASLGQAAGDDVLRSVARRLVLADADGGCVARAGADTFLVLYRARDSAAAERRAEELGLCLRPPIDYRGVQLRVGCRLGLALFPLHGGTATELLQRADIALAESKRSGARLSVFVPGAEQDHRRRIELLGELQRAISGDELELFYQPKVTARERAVVGCEALIRWRHPVRGYVRPAEFIPQAERAGSIREVTRWVVDHALAQLARWHAEGRALDLAVNLSAADLASPSFAAWIAARIVESGAPAGRLVLEVTESAAMHELPRALAAMDQLRVLGVRFSIDDFGTGYSSLAQLKQLPVDELKIDRAFIRDLDGAGATDQIVRATVQMGHALGLKVVAEGVEDEAGAAAVTALGCDLIQGYLITAALPIAEFEAWLQRPTSSPSITSDSDAANLTQGSVSGSARAVLR